MATTTDIPSPPSAPDSPLRPPQPAAPSVHRWPWLHLVVIFALWFAIFAAALVKPPLLDDADATHSQAAQAMLRTGDLVTLHVDGIRYLEKPPLPYWIAAGCLSVFDHRGPQASALAAFAIHLPLALTVLALALLGYAWSRRAFDRPRIIANRAAAPPLPNRTALYTAIFVLTSAGVFLFTRIFIPDALLSLLLAFCLYAMLRALEIPAPSVPGRASSRFPAPWAYAMWASLALAVLTKGLVAIVFLFGAGLIFLVATGEFRDPRAVHRLRPVTGCLLFLAIAAPWHILAGLRNTGGANGHGFFWFYFVNEHFLRFLGRRIPRDYNKLPGYLYWSLHIVWLFPWSLFAPAAIVYAWRRYRAQQLLADPTAGGHPLSRLDLLKANKTRRQSPAAQTSFTHRTVLLLSIFSVLVLVFFSISTNQEYYTFPVYLPLLMLLAAALTAIDRTQFAYTPGAPCPDSGTWVSNTPGTPSSSPLFVAQPGATPAPPDSTFHRTLTFAFATLTVLGLGIAAALSYGLWSARHLPFVHDIGSLLAHRDVGGYTLSMSHFFDLTGPSFAALRLPAALAAAAFLLGPAIAWMFYRRRARALGLSPTTPNPTGPSRTGHFPPGNFRAGNSLLLAPILTLALTNTVFLIAAHIALERFAPMLSSESFAVTIQSLERSGRISPHNIVLIYGDQAFGSSVIFYLNQDSTAPTRRVDLVDGRTTSMLFGSTFPDAPPIFLTHQQLLAQWGHGPRKLLFVPLGQRDAVDRLLGSRQILLQETSGKALITDRPLNPIAPPQP